MIYELAKPYAILITSGFDFFCYGCTDKRKLLAISGHSKKELTANGQ
jgi:hypothetical protein